MSAIAVEIKEANFEGILECASIAIIGKRRTGKTTWAKYIVQSIASTCDRFVVISGTRDNVSEWKDVISPLFIVGKSIEYLRQVKEYQDTKCSLYTSDGHAIPRKYKITIILDDCGSDKKFMHHNVMKDILSNGRHYGMNIIILAQYINQMHSGNRDQLDYVGVLHTSNQKNVKKIHEEYGSVCSLREFRYILRALTVDRGMCWIDNTKSSSDASDCIFYKKLSLPYEFKHVGSELVNSFSESHYIGRDLMNTHRSESKALDIKQLSIEQTTTAHSRLGSVLVDFTNKEDMCIVEDVLDTKTTFTDNKGDFTIRKCATKQKLD